MYSDKIVNAYKKYADFEVSIDYCKAQYSADEKKRVRKAERLHKAFEKACFAEGYKENDIYKISIDIVNQIYDLKTVGEIKDFPVFNLKNK